MEQLVDVLHGALNTADELGLHMTALHINAAIVSLGGEGALPPTVAALPFAAVGMVRSPS